MASSSRVTLPQEFFDITSDMLLVQPEPQYLYAQLWKASVGAELGMSSALGMPGRQFGSSGASYGSLEADRLMLDNPLATGVIKSVVELGKAPGHTVRMNRPVFPNTTYTQASREVPVGSSISTTGIAAASEQVAITLKRFSGPYDSGNSRVAPYAIERFDANLALHKMVDIHGKNMKRDFDKFIDSVMVSLLDNASQVVRPSGMSADNDSSTAGDFPMDWNTMARAAKELDEDNIPTFGDGKRMLVITPQQKQQISDDPQFARYAEYHKEMNPLFGGSYYKTAGDFHVFVCNTLTVSNNSNSIPIHTAHAFGPGVLGSGLGELPRVAYASEDNYGETAKVIWLLYAGFALLDNRFVLEIHTS